MLAVARSGASRFDPDNGTARQPWRVNERMRDSPMECKVCQSPDVTTVARVGNLNLVLCSACDQACRPDAVPATPDMDQSKLDQVNTAGGEDGVIFEFVIPASVMIRNGVVEWSYIEAGGSLASINNAESGNEYSGEEFDEILNILGDIADSVLRNLIND